MIISIYKPAFVLAYNKSGIRYLFHSILYRCKMTEVVVEVKQGKLRGVMRNNIDGGQYFSFRGVPFAQPPVGELRFKEPLPPKPWMGIKNAVDESKMSAQYDSTMNLNEGGDDCLYLNIATNSLTEKKPVMVWIHGGGFLSSSNTYKKYSPDYLLKKDIIFVSVNYRLGVLGFLNMEHEECAGNQGLKDQIAALKWVHENIEVFGGDTKNITIFGESAGAAAVHALCISPKAEGLFHKAILQSGVVSNPWAHIASNKEYGYSLAEALGKKCSNSLEVIQFLRTIPALELVEMFINLNPKKTQELFLTLVPSIDDKSENPVLSQPVTKMARNGINIPVIIGYNSHEGILRLLSESFDFIKEMNNDFDQYLARYLRDFDVNKISQFSKNIRKFYFGEDEINEEKINELVQFFGDLLFVCNIHELADIQMQKMSPTYLYKYSYRSDFPGIKDRYNVKIEGTCHAEELGCLFYSEMRRGKLEDGTRDRKASDRMVTMWTNFAKFSNPTPMIDELIPVKWQPLEKSKKYYYEINDNLKCGENPDEEMWKIWKPLLDAL